MPSSPPSTVAEPPGEAGGSPNSEGSRPPADLISPDILVVDDTPQNLLAVRVVMDALDYRLVTARSGDQALRQVLERDFALILLDVQMPGMDGFECARLIRARKRSRHVPIIFITAHDGTSADVLEAYKLGAVDFLFKPIEPDILRAKATVFVELARRTAEVEYQSRRLQEHEQLERERALQEQRTALEALALSERLAEQRRHARELKGLNRRLAQDDRRKDEFIAVLGHELRNPLAPLVNGLELLRNSEDEHVQGARTIMTRQVDHLIRLVDDLLDMARIARGKIELQRSRVNILSVVNQALEIAAPLIRERGHQVTLDTPNAEVCVVGDEVRLTQVVANLVNNAARYTPASGRIGISVAEKGDEICIEVRDSGQGIAPEVAERVFDLFVQEKAGGGGLGIGLTLVKQLVRLHRGRVSAHSDGIAQGSQFVVWLPRGDQEGEPVANSSRPPDDAGATGDETLPSAAGLFPSETGLRVVLVEDNEDAREMMCAMLVSWGHSVEGVGTGQAGIDLLLKRKPDLAFVDIGLPDMDGYDVAAAIRVKLGPAGPRLIAVSGFGQPRDRDRALQSGFDQHLTKPTSIEDIRQALASVHTQRSAAG